jgi:ABC-type uncharacterized transport system involved in gliding motility auxiliary subunit
MLKRILGLLGWLGVALVFAAVAIRFLRPEWQDWVFWLSIAGLVCVLLYVLSDWRSIARSFSGREARFGSIAAASIAIVLAILIGINFLANRRNKRWDLTAAKQFTLSDQTRKVLQSLQKPVAVRVFARTEDFDRFRARLDEYRYVSNKLSVEYVDVERRPAVANQYGVQQVGTVVFDYDGRIERVTSDSEQDLTNGLIKVVQGKKSKVYFVIGHGEKPIDGSDRQSYSAILTSLKSDNFEYDSLALAQQQSVPADATVVVVAGPETDLFPAEIDLLKKYLAGGGKLFLLVDPPRKPDGPDLDNVVALLKEWAIEVGKNVVVDVSGMGRLLGTGAEVPLAARYDSHPITERFRLMTAYPMARSISSISAGANNRFAQNLIETSPNSWAETNIKDLMAATSQETRVELEEDKGDKKGPISLGAAVSAPAEKPATPASDKNDGSKPPETRIVAIGDSDFATNGWLGIPGNRDLFMNTLNWLAQQENLISIRPRDPEDRRITLTATQERNIFWLTVFIIPGLILLAGVRTWWKRR